jgi:lysozyme
MAAADSAGIDLMRHTLLLCFAALLAFTACGRRETVAKLGDVRVSVAAPAPVRFSDAKPVAWSDRHPARYPVHGIDVARFQTTIDWPTVRANGVSFAFIKATEGGDLVDPMFKDHWRNARRAGIPRGAYHFYYHCRPAAEQARWFFRNVPKEPGMLPPVLDMEWTPFSPTCTTRRPASEIRDDARRIIGMFAAHYGTQPILYTTVDFFRDNELWRLSGVDFWLRSVTAHPAERYPGHDWTFWQYSGTATIPGVQGQVDANAFAGSAAAWQNWLLARQL